jgi:hypothetical protein
MREQALKLSLLLVVALICGQGPAEAQKREYRVTVTNSTNFNLEYFYFSACGTNDWGSDRLGKREVIEPGRSRIFNLHDGNDDCCRDMRATFASSASRQRLGVDVCKIKEWVLR